MASFRLLFILRPLLFVGSILLILHLAFPVISGHGPAPKRIVAAYEEGLLVTALKGYRNDYDRFPPLDKNGGTLSQASQGELIRILTGNHETWNPRRITFFEVPNRVPEQTNAWFFWKRRPVPAIDRNTGAFTDPWGRPYQVLFDTDYDYRIVPPYEDQKEVSAEAIVWSLGKDGVQGAPDNPRHFKGSDDIVSWNH